MPDATLATKRSIEIDGSALQADVEGQLESVLIVDRLAMPDTFSLVFRDPDRDILTRAGLEIGKKVKISTALRSDSPKPLIDGEVTSIEADYDTLGARAIVRGYDLSHRLNAGRKTKTYQNVKLSDVASQLASAAGLQADVDDSGGTVEHLLQPNLSDLDFLYSLARRIGFDCRVDGAKLYFKRPTASSAAPGVGEVGTENPVQLVWSDNLLEFRARVSAVAQVSEVKVRGWDVQNKKAVIGQADVSATNAELPDGPRPADLARKVGGQTLVVVDRPVGTQEAADALASAKAEQVGSAAFEATAVAIGSPELRAGTAVSISGVDRTLEGKWVISSTRHEFGAGPYRTHLEFSGRQDRSLHGLVANGLPGSAGERIRVPGVVIAIVTNNDDPDKQGRVKLKYPWLSDDAESFWARVAMPGAGADSGMVWIPQVGDEVLVAFEHGDFAHPVVIGGLWNGKDAAPLGDGLFDAGSVKRSGFISRKGHKVVFFDGDDESGIALLSQDGKFKVSLNETKGQLHIKADGKLVIEAKSLEIKVDTDAKLNAAGVSLEASGQVKIKGATVALN
jgi:phage protein D/phage baseplate assembly protein gpV